jgi:hypothetical protein
MMTTNSHESQARAARYAQHVTDLAHAFEVRLFVHRRMSPSGAGAGFVTIGGIETLVKRIDIAPVTDEATYAVALHELGHCLHPLGMLHTQGSKMMRRFNQLATFRDVRLKLESERAAWEWAHHYALEWTDTMAYVERVGLQSYDGALLK